MAISVTPLPPPRYVPPLACLAHDSSPAGESEGKKTSLTRVYGEFPSGPTETEDSLVAIRRIAELSERHRRGPGLALPLNPHPALQLPFYSHTHIMPVAVPVQPPQVELPRDIKLGSTEVQYGDFRDELFSNGKSLFPPGS